MGIAFRRHGPSFQVGTGRVRGLKDPWQLSGVSYIMTNGDDDMPAEEAQAQRAARGQNLVGKVDYEYWGPRRQQQCIFG